MGFTKLAIFGAVRKFVGTVVARKSESNSTRKIHIVASTFRLFHVKLHQTKVKYATTYGIHFPFSNKGLLNSLTGLFWALVNQDHWPNK